MILVGSKSDNGSKRDVSREEATEFARKHNMGFIEASAQTGIHVKEVFHDIIRYISGVLHPPKKKYIKK